MIEMLHKNWLVIKMENYYPKNIHVKNTFCLYFFYHIRCRTNKKVRLNNTPYSFDPFILYIIMYMNNYLHITTLIDVVNKYIVHFLFLFLKLLLNIKYFLLCKMDINNWKVKTIIFWIRDNFVKTGTLK